MSALPKQPPVISEEPVSCDEMQALAAKLEKLVTHHQAALREENVLEPVEKLLRWVEGCQGGSSKAERNLYQQGMTLMDEVHNRLHLALEEELRMSDESPAVAATARGRTADRYAKATAKTADAREALVHITEHDPENA